MTFFFRLLRVSRVARKPKLTIFLFGRDHLSSSGERGQQKPLCFLPPHRETRHSAAISASVYVSGVLHLGFGPGLLGMQFWYFCQRVPDKRYHTRWNMPVATATAGGYWIAKVAIHGCHLQDIQAGGSQLAWSWNGGTQLPGEPTHPHQGATYYPTRQMMLFSATKSPLQWGQK